MTEIILNKVEKSEINLVATIKTIIPFQISETTCKTIFEQSCRRLIFKENYRIIQL